MDLLIHRGKKATFEVAFKLGQLSLHYIDIIGLKIVPFSSHFQMENNFVLCIFFLFQKKTPMKYI